MIKCIILDFDGVVNISDEKFNKIFEKKHPDEKSLMDFFNNEYKLCRLGQACVRTEFAKYLEGTRWTVDEMLDYWHNLDWRLNEELLAYVKRLRGEGFLTVIATNQADTRTEFMIEHEIGSYFDEIIASCNLGHDKPNVEFYEGVYDILKCKYGVAKDELLFFDDAEINVVGANEFGIKSFMYVGFAEFEEELKKTLMISS